MSTNNKIPNEEVSETVSFIVNVAIHCLILLAILSVFFLLIVSNVEKQAFQSQFDDISTTDTVTILEAVDSNLPGQPVKKYLKDNSNQINYLYQLMNVQDPLKVANNHWLFVTNAIVLALLILSLAAVCLTICFVAKKRVPLGRILVENCIVFLMVGAVELLFFLNIASKYAPVQPSFITERIINRTRTNILGPNVVTSSSA